MEKEDKAVQATFKKIITKNSNHKIQTKKCKTCCAEERTKGERWNNKETYLQDRIDNYLQEYEVDMSFNERI